MNESANDCNALQLAVIQCAAGRKPELDLEALDRIGGEYCRIGVKVRQAICVLVTDAKALFQDRDEWLAWINRTFSPSNPADRSHIIKIGSMLTRLRDMESCNALQSYCEIFGYGFNKLYEMTKLPPERIPAFLSHTPTAAKMDSKEMRAAVDAYLSGAAAPAVAAPAVQPLLPGFDDALDAIFGLEDKILTVAANPAFNIDVAAKMTFSGVQLCRASVGYLAAHLDELDDEMVDDLTKNLDMIRQRLGDAVADRHRKRLGND